MLAFKASALPLVLATFASAQESAYDLLELRVTATYPRQVVVDRGSFDGLAKLDRVVFRPREGGAYEGTVVRIGDRAAVVELVDPSFVPAPGTRGEARIPRSRFAPQIELAPATPVDEAPSATEPAEETQWENTDEGWSDDQPLLAQVRPFRPEQRPSSVTGRAYTILDSIRSTEDDRTDTFARLGGSLLYTNVGGHGGDLRIDGELNYRNTDVPDEDDDQRSRIRLDRLSYTIGGDRFAPNRVEIGRFLHLEMPEFGVIDGLDWTHRFELGDRFGASVGLMPEPDAEQASGDDLELAAYYRWVADESERFSIAGGYQKTFHDLAADRDLLVAKLAYLPSSDWTLIGTTWVDFYTDGDENKGAGLELSQARILAARRYDSGSTLRFTYTHLAFPEIERDEFLPVTANQLADDHNDRVALYGRAQMTDDIGIFAEAGGWTDEDEEGGDGEFGFDVADVLFEDGRADLAVFGTKGRHSTLFGGRVSLGSWTELGGWRIGYELTQNQIDGFSDANNELPEHRIDTSWDFNTLSRWSISAHVEALLYDDETAFSGGLFLQRSF